MEIVLVALLALSVILVAGLALAQSGDPPAPGKPAPEFHLVAADGTEYSLRSLHGRRAVLCFHPQDETPECLAYVGRLQAVASEVEAAGASLFAVVVSAPPAADAYARVHGPGLRVLCDADGKTARSYGALVNLGVMKFARKLIVLVDARGVVERAWHDIPGLVPIDELMKALAAPRG